MVTTVKAATVDKEVRLTVGSNSIYKNGEKIEIDAPMQLLNYSRNFVSLRVVSEIFDCEVKWNEKFNAVEILKGSYYDFTY